MRLFPGCGKSTFLIQLAQKLGRPPRTIAFLDFSKLPLRDFGSSDFERLHPLSFPEYLRFLKAEDLDARRRVYLADNGLTLYTRPPQPDRGKRFENHMYPWLTRLGQRVGFGKTERGELDLLFSGTSAQVCLSINLDNASRELEPLRTARDRGQRAILIVRDRREIDASIIRDLEMIDIRDLLLDPQILI